MQHVRVANLASFASSSGERSRSRSRAGNVTFVLFPGRGHLELVSSSELPASERAPRLAANFLATARPRLMEISPAFAARFNKKFHASSVLHGPLIPNFQPGEPWNRLIPSFPQPSRRIGSRSVISLKVIDLVSLFDARVYLEFPQFRLEFCWNSSMKIGNRRKIL